MGSTVSTVFFTDDTMIAANVGDSPIYLIHNGNIEIISVLHTVIAEQAAIDPEAAANLGPEFKHMLTQGMGIDDAVKPDLSELQCYKGDMLVLCSDGLSDKVSPEEIRDIVIAERPNKACRTLVDMANNRGGDDNTTIVILKIKDVYSNNGFKGKIIGLLNTIKSKLR
jgi:protein phosphatase